MFGRRIFGRRGERLNAPPPSATTSQRALSPARADAPSPRFDPEAAQAEMRRLSMERVRRDERVRHETEAWMATVISQLGDTLLDTVLEPACAVEKNARDQIQTLSKALRGIPQSERCALFTLLVAERDGMDVPTGTSDRVLRAKFDGAPRIAALEVAIAATALAGPLGNESAARRILSDLAVGRIAIDYGSHGKGRHGTTNDSYGRFPIFAELERALRERARSDMGVRTDARTILERYLGRAPSEADPTRTERREIVALRSLAGLVAQQPFHVRHRGIVTPRTLEPDYWDAILTRLPCLERVLPIAAILRDDILRHYASNTPPRSWINDRALFAELFGEGDRPAQRYGWWNEPTDGAEGFKERRDERDFATTRRTNWPLLTPERVRERRRELEAFVQPSPARFDCDRVPGMDLFEGGGEALLDHLVTNRGAKPSKTWVNRLNREIGALGHDRTFSVLAAWVRLVTEQELPKVDEEAWHSHDRFASSLFFALNGTSGEKEAPAVDDERAWRRLALEMIARNANFLFDRQLPRRDERPKGAEQMARRRGQAFSDPCVSVAVGVAWALSHFGVNAVASLEAMALESYGTARGEGRNDARSVKVGNACVWALGEIG